MYMTHSALLVENLSSTNNELFDERRIPWIQCRKQDVDQLMPQMPERL